VADCEDDEAGRLAKAFLQAREMEQVRSYLERGRPWEHLPVGELERRWRTAGEAFIGNDDQSQVRPFQDFDAEYKLRDLIPPHKLLRPAVDKAVERMERYSDKDFENVRQRMDEFVRDLEKPKN
jgi:hypothetical protein